MHAPLAAARAEPLLWDEQTFFHVVIHAWLLEEIKFSWSSPSLAFECHERWVDPRRMARLSVTMWRLVIQALPLWLSVVEGQSPVNGTVSVPFNQRTTEQLYFGISLELGKPPQRVSFAIAPCCSTDSSWTVDRNANYTNGSTTGFPDPFGKPFTFDADASSSLQRRKDSVSSGYGFNTSFEGHKVQDVVALGNVTSDGDFLYLAEESNRVPGDISFDDISRWLKDGSHTDQSVYRIWLNGPGKLDVPKSCLGKD